MQRRLIALVALLVIGSLLATGCGENVSATQTVDEFKTEHISVPLKDTEQGVITLSPSAFDTAIRPLEDSASLLEAKIDYVGELIVESEARDDAYFVSIEQDNQNLNYDGKFRPSWDVKLSPDVPLELVLNMSAGDLDANLSELQLSQFNLNMSAGDATVHLPVTEETLPAMLDMSAGDLLLTIPEGARIDWQHISMSAGDAIFRVLGSAAFSGSVNMSAGDFELDVPKDLPDNLGIQITIAHKSAGHFRPHIEMQKVRNGADEDEGVWQTANYDDAEYQIALVFDMSAGNVTIR